MSKDFYKILGVEKNASEADIKVAFRKLAHQHHPDKNKGDDKKFKEINEAYQTLSDKTKRAQYDQFGSSGPQFGGGGNPFGGAGGNPFEGFDFSQFQQGAGGFEFDLGDLFGGGFGGGRGRPRKGNDLETSIKITFKESVFGVEKKVALTKNNTCATCHGNGAKPGTSLHTCKTCNGQGRVTRVQRTILGNMQTAIECDVCFGTGKVPETKCDTCRGAGIVRGKEELTIHIPEGINNGDTLRMDGAGEAMPGVKSGDLYIHIQVESHATFKRMGNDLIMPLEIKLVDALLGKNIEIETLDGKEILEVPEGTATGDQLKIRHKGIPHGRSRGDIIVGIKVTIPKRLSKKAKELIEVLKLEL
ncbi:MAG: molecular chaperone DnaJ [bacterium]